MTIHQIELPCAQISIVILTYNRIDALRKLLSELEQLSLPRPEVIVVDNFSDTPASTLASDFPEVVFLRSPSNLGTGGRNIGIFRASSDIVVCLDDDVGGLSSSSVEKIPALFEDPSVGAICFKVLEEGTGEVTNWVHHRDVARYADSTFPTYEITEGAVAYRRKAFLAAGGYAENFFISHEGPDLAFRIMGLGYNVIYNPEIVVVHAYSPLARATWRNYYYDTRNTFWLVARNCRVMFGLKLMVRQVGGMLIYAIRDGFFLWWVRGVRDGLVGLPRSIRERQVMSKETMSRVAAIDGYRESFWRLVRLRVLRRGVKI